MISGYASVSHLVTRVKDHHVISHQREKKDGNMTTTNGSFLLSYTVKPVYAVTSIKQSPVLRGHL